MKAKRINRQQFTIDRQTWIKQDARIAALEGCLREYERTCRAPARFDCSVPEALAIIEQARALLAKGKDTARKINR